MPTPSTCPGCHAAVPADLPANGKCGWCGCVLTEIVDLGEPVEVPEASNPTPADATLFDLTPNLAPESAPMQKAVPDVRRVAEAEGADEPTLPKPKAARRVAAPEPRPPSDDRPLTRRQQVRAASRRVELDDDDAPRPRRPAKKSGGGKTALVLGLVFVVLLIGCGGAATLGYWLYGRSPDGAATFSPASSPTAPAKSGNPTPGPAVSQAPTWERGWANLLQADGFSVRLPIGATGGPKVARIGDEPALGHRYEVEEGGVQYRVEWYDLPNELPLDAGTFARRNREPDLPRVTHQSGPSPIQLGDHSAQEVTYRGLAGEWESIRALKVGPRVFLFTCRFDPNLRAAYPGLNQEAKARAFFDSVRVTYSAATPPPRSLGSKTTLPPILPPTEAVFTLASAGTVAPHTAAVYLPKKKELLTFTARGGGGRGLGQLGRYDAATFKQILSAALPKPISLAAADEAAGRLYVATYAPGPGPDPRERLDAVGDVQVFNLAAILTDGPPAAGSLTPTATFTLGAKVTALELAPDGRTLYAAVISPPGGLPAKPKTKLLKLALPALTPAGEIELPAPVLGARLSPDGKYLFAFEHPFNQVGQPVFGTGAAASVRVIDAVGWKEVRSVPLPGLPSDLRFVAADRALVIVTTANRPRLFAVGVTGEPVDVTPAGGLKSLQAGYLGFAAGRLVTSARIPGTTGTEVLAIGPPRSLAFESMLGPATLSGPVTVTPDGRFAVFASGAVAEVKGK